MEKLKENKLLVIAIIAIVILGVVVFFGDKMGMKNSNNNQDDMDVNDSKQTGAEANFNIVKTKASSLTLEDYSTDVFSMKKPQGWSVEAGGSGIYYAIRVYDPQDTNNQVFLMLKMQPLLKSNTAKSAWQNYYQLSGNNSQYKVFADAVVLDNPTTEGFYSKFGEICSYMNGIELTLASFRFPTLNSFAKQEEFESSSSMKNVALDSKVLRATFTGDNQKNGEGLFMASIVNFGTQYQGGADMGYYMIYDIMAITADKDEFINYKDILLQSVNSIEFSNAYVTKTIDDGNAQTKQALALNASIQKSFESYMNAWENRQKSYDIMSQKQSDAILGYERVYDTENGDIYKTYNGFTDDYTGNRYQTITDEMYTNKIEGYIEKK